MDPSLIKIDNPAVLASRRRSETPYGTGGPTIVGEFRGGRDYASWRPKGTADWLMILTLEGSGLILGPDNHGFRTAAGDLILFPPGTYQDYGTDPEAGRWHLLWSHFQPRVFWTPWLNWPARTQGIRHRHAAPPVAESCAAALRDALQSKLARTPLASEFATHCVERVLLHLHAGQEDVRTLDDRIRESLAFISQNPGYPHTVPDLARRAGLSPSRFAHLFREQTGESPQKAWEHHRLRLACHYLSFTSWPIGEVGRQVGFEDPYHFSARFRAWTGKSPRQYRKGQSA